MPLPAPLVQQVMAYRALLVALVQRVIRARAQAEADLLELATATACVA